MCPFKFYVADSRERGCRLAWSRLGDLGSLDPGSNPGSPISTDSDIDTFFIFSNLELCLSTDELRTKTFFCMNTHAFVGFSTEEIHKISVLSLLNFFSASDVSKFSKTTLKSSAICTPLGRPRSKLLRLIE